MRVLVTGGAGYIGSHVLVELIKHGHDAVVIDNFSNSRPEVIDSVNVITNTAIPVYKGDVQDYHLLDKIFRSHDIHAVIHLAGLKSVSESINEPLTYYQANLVSSLTLCRVMRSHSIKQLIFSSSATVYGEPEELPLKESSRTGYGIANPYGQTKYMIERILEDIVAADASWAITSLRYFNPIGAHESGKLGEDPQGTPNNLMPYVAKVATGELDTLRIYGNDYPTQDGTGARDYIHVVDLAKGHVAALENLRASGKMELYNLGTGKDITVLEVVQAFESASGKTISYEIVGRRAGDIASVYADPSKAHKELGWKATRSIQQACIDAWRWQRQRSYRK